MGPQVQEDRQNSLEQAGTCELLPDVLESYSTIDAFSSTFTKDDHLIEDKMMASKALNGGNGIICSNGYTNGYAIVSNGISNKQRLQQNVKITPSLPSATSSYLTTQSPTPPLTTTAATTAAESAAIKQIDNRILFEEPPWYISLSCYLSYVVLNAFGHLRDFLRYIGLEENKTAVEEGHEGYAPLYKSYECFYTRNIYRRIRDVWNRPIASVPGVFIDLIDRVSHDYNWTFEYTGTTTKVVNMGSYNYLGFAENTGAINDKIIETIRDKGVSVCSSRVEYGNNDYLVQLETMMARFLGVPACVVFGMGFATNSTNIQCIAQKGTLILSDELNHASLILGCRLSGATIRVFKHNDMKDLEKKLRTNIINGQPNGGKSWRKIVICVEGIYSMEGTIVNLPALLALKKKYKCYLYLDEAHSIGAMGLNGRGVTDYYNCDPNDIDILMGTFTKSFGAAGGYVAGRREVIDYIRYRSYSSYYATPMAPVIAMQIMQVVRIITGEDGTGEGRKRISILARNTRYFRRRLKQMGFIVYGHNDSPVVPLLLCFCPKIPAVIRLAFERGFGFIGVGFPATSLTTSRVRFCISASHNQEMLDRALEVMNEIGDKLEIKYSRIPVDQTVTINY